MEPLARRRGGLLGEVECIVRRAQAYASVSQPHLPPQATSGARHVQHGLRVGLGRLCMVKIIVVYIFFGYYPHEWR